MANLNDKLALMKPALLVAGAIVSNLPDNLKPDPEGQDPSVVQENDMAFRLARTLHAWLCQSIGDATLWPKPPEGVSPVVLLEASAGLVAGIVSNYLDELPLDVATADPKVVQTNSAVWRHWRTVYAWLGQSLSDDVMWAPAPALGPAAGPANATASGAARNPQVLLTELQNLLSSDLKAQAIEAVKNAMMGA